MSVTFSPQLLEVPKPDLSKGQRKGSFWSKEEPVVDPSTGIVSRGGMWNHQLRFWELDNFVKALVGGYGSGKTLVLGKRAISLSLMNAPCPVAVVSPTFPLAKQTTIPTIKELLDGKQSIIGKRRFAWSYNATEHRFTIKHGGRKATLIVYSGEHPIRLKGPNLAAALIDEPFIQEEDVFTQMVARVRHPLSQHKELALTGTPESIGWGYDLCVGEWKDRYDVGVVHAHTALNRALGDDYVTRLESAFTGKAAEAYISGHFVNLAEGLVYYAFSPEDNIVTQDDPPSGARLGAGMDFNVNPMAAVVFWRKGEHIHFFDEIELPNADTEYMCQVLREKYWEMGLREVYPDASGKERSTNAPGGRSDFNIIEDFGFVVQCPPKNPPRRDRFNAANGKLKARDGSITCTLSPKMKKLRKYFMTLSHERLLQQERKTHLTDAATYPIAFLYPLHRTRIHTRPLRGY